MEQFYQSQKSQHFNDDSTTERIMISQDPAEIMHLARRIRGYKEADWSTHKLEVMYKGVLAKFMKNENLKTELLSTGTKVLCESSPHDLFWGPGLPMNHKLKWWNIYSFTLLRAHPPCLAFSTPWYPQWLLPSWAEYLSKMVVQNCCSLFNFHTIHHLLD